MQRLTAKQEAFVAAYAANGGTNGAAAAREAGYTAPNVAAARLLASDSVKAAVQARMGKAMARLERKRDYSVDRILEALHDLAFFDSADLFADDGSLKPLRDIPVETRRVIAGLEVAEIKRDKVPIGKLKKVKLTDRLSALQMLARYHSLFKDRVEHTGEITTIVVPDRVATVPSDQKVKPDFS